MESVAGFFKGIRNFFVLSDKILILLSIAASAYGMLLIASATNTFSSDRNFNVQLFAIFIGLVMMLIISKIDYSFFSNISKLLFLFGTAMIILTILIGVGPPGTDNKNWIKLGSFNLQFSEFYKIIFVITFGTHLSNLGENINDIKKVLALTIHGMFYVGMVAIQGDIGSALVFLCMFNIMIFSAGLKLRYFVAEILVAVLASPFIWQYFLKEYMRNRILAGFNPELFPSGAGYQAIQSKIAIGSGGFWGKGLFNGTQIQYDLLPFKHTDFIFAVAGEELGFIGAMLVLGVLLAIIFRVLYVSQVAKDRVGHFFCIGILSIIVVQTFENIGMCLGMLPDRKSTRLNSSH